MTKKIDKVVNYMLTHDGITQMDAYELCKATRLGAIIFDLKNRRGYEIETFYHQQEHGRYAEYCLTPKCKKELKKSFIKTVEDAK